MNDFVLLRLHIDLPENNKFVNYLFCYWPDIKYRTNHCISLLSDLHFFFMLKWSAFCEQCVMDLAWKQPILVLADIAVGVATDDRPIHYGCMYSHIQRTMLSLKRKTIFAPPKNGTEDGCRRCRWLCVVCVLYLLLQCARVIRLFSRSQRITLSCSRE